MVMKNNTIIGGLSDDVIYAEIFPLMDTKEVVQTCILSKAWRNFWKKIDILSFDPSYSLYKNRIIFHNFVCHVLKHRNQSNLRRVKFFARGDDLSALSQTVFDYAALHNATEIETDIFQFPQNLIASKTLKTLKIRPGAYATTTDPLSFTHLTTLHLIHVKIKGTRCDDLVSNCQNLENLHIVKCEIDKMGLVIKSPKLTNLTIKDVVKDRDLVNGRWTNIDRLKKLQILCKNLKKLKIEWRQHYRPKNIDMFECRRVDEVELKMSMHISLVSDQFWKTCYINYMKFTADNCFARVDNLTFALEFSGGKFILSRSGLSGEIQFEEFSFA